jgi:parallel beta-helix repeat protein
VCKFIACHPYFCAGDGFYAAVAYCVQIIGGEYETNTGWGINLAGVHGGQITDITQYGNGAGDIKLNSCDKMSVRGNQMSSAGAFNVFGEAACNDCVIANNICENATAHSITLTGSTRCAISANRILPNIIQVLQLYDSTYCTVIGNVIQNTAIEQETSDYNLITGNIFLSGSFTVVGAHTVAAHNLP